MANGQDLVYVPALACVWFDAPLVDEAQRQVEAVLFNGQHDAALRKVLTPIDVCHDRCKSGFYLVVASPVADKFLDNVQSKQLQLL